MKTVLKPRKSPRQKRAHATCDAILEAAAQIVATHGLKGFNTNAVAERAGVSIGSLYQYFPNKDALMVALIERQQQRQYETLTSAVALLPETDVKTTIRLVARAAMQHHHDDSLFASAIDHEETRLPVAGLLNSYLQKGGALMAGLIAKHAREIGPIDLEAAARTIPAMTRAIVDAWANQNPPQLDRAEEEVVRAVSGYLMIGMKGEDLHSSALQHKAEPCP